MVTSSMGQLHLILLPEVPRLSIAKLKSSSAKSWLKQDFRNPVSAMVLFLFPTVLASKIENKSKLFINYLTGRIILILEECHLRNASLQVWEPEVLITNKKSFVHVYL